MIKINELRIGNIVEYNGFHLPVYSITGAFPRKKLGIMIRHWLIYHVTGLLQQMKMK